MEIETSGLIRSLSVEELADHLTQNGVSSKAIKCLRDNEVSDRALLLVDDFELKELLHTIGDRAIVRDILNKARKVRLFLHLRVTKCAPSALYKHVMHKIHCPGCVGYIGCVGCI